MLPMRSFSFAHVCSYVIMSYFSFILSVRSRQVHYDELHTTRGKRQRQPAAVAQGLEGARYRLSNKVMNCYNSNRHEQLRLPEPIKEILQSRSDEQNWDTLERLRIAIVGEVEGVSTIPVTDSATIEAVATAIEANDERGHEGIMGTDVCDPYNEGIVLVPAGAQVDIKVPQLSAGVPRTRAARRRVRAAAVQQLSRSDSDILRVRRRPRGTPLAMDLDDMGKAMMTEETAQAIADSWTPKLTKEQLLDKMLLVLWDALMLSASERWTALGVANLHHERTHLLAHSFLKGQAIGSRPLHDGICAYCGAFLYGVQNDNSALSNKCVGSPIDVRGTLLRTSDDREATDAQPPFLLAYSPALLAREAPAVFEHDPESNRLSLKSDVARPWVRPEHSRQEPGVKTWKYCCECRDRYLPESRSRKQGHVPLRDKTSWYSRKREKQEERRSDGAPDEEPPDQGEPEDEDPGDAPDDEAALGDAAAVKAFSELAEAAEHEAAQEHESAEDCPCADEVKRFHERSTRSSADRRSKYL